MIIGSMQDRSHHVRPVHCAEPSDDDSDAAQRRQPAPQQPAPHPSSNPGGDPRAQPDPPANKPLPELPDPTEVGEDG